MGLPLLTLIFKQSWQSLHTNVNPGLIAYYRHPGLIWQSLLTTCQASLSSSPLPTRPHRAEPPHHTPGLLTSTQASSGRASTPGLIELSFLTNFCPSLSRSQMIYNLFRIIVCGFVMMGAGHTLRAYKPPGNLATSDKYDPFSYVWGLVCY